MDNTIDRQLKYGNTFIKTYNVNYDSNNTLIATESTYVEPVVSKKEKNDEEFNLMNYINALHTSIIKNIPMKVYNTPYKVEYNEDYLVVVEKSSSSLLKRVFDLRNIELPEKIKQEIREIQDCLKNNKKSSYTSKYIPLIRGIVDNKTVPLIKEEDEDEFKSFFENTVDFSNERRYLRDKNKITNIVNYDLLSTYIIFDILARNKNIANFYNEHFITTIIGYTGLYIFLDKLYNKIGKNMINKSVNNDFNDYLELCHKIASGDKETIKYLTQEIGIEGTYNNANNSEFYLNLVRDLTILNCYKDESLNPIKIELVSLGCEYVEYRSSSSEKEIIEELFMNKLKAIEEKIDLTNKQIEDKDDDTMNFISTHCDFDEENHLRLIPIISNQKNNIYIKEI